MTNETLIPEQKQALLAAIPKIEKAGGPKWYEWCDLENELIYGHPYTQQYDEGPINPMEHEDQDCYCPPAVAAAVIAWAGEVQDHYEGTLGWWACRVSFDRSIRKWEVSVGDTIGSCHVWPFYTQLTASVALISAVAEGLGDGNG